MLYAITLIDRSDAGDLRSRVIAEHRAYLAQMAERIAFAGPFLGDDGEAMVGSLLVIDFADRGAAESWLRSEPFTRAGLYATTSIRAFRNRWPQKTGFPEG